MSGLGRCTLCGGSLIAMSRHHGRRRGFFYGCAYNSKRGPRICTNNFHMPQVTLEDAVAEAVASKFDETALGAAIDRALELLEDERQTANERRKAIEEPLRTVRNEEARLVDAVKQGETLDASSPLCTTHRSDGGRSKVSLPESMPAWFRNSPIPSEFEPSS